MRELQSSSVCDLRSLFAKISGDGGIDGISRPDIRPADAAVLSVACAYDLLGP